MGSEQNDGTSYSPSEPKLCANGCGFFGTAANMNLCSKCYADLRVKEEQAASAKAAMEKSLNRKSQKQSDKAQDFMTSNVAVTEPPAFVGSSSSSLSACKPSLTFASGNDQPAPPKVATRCSSCNKKVGLTGFTCKCGSTFCGVHRYPEKHECTFDFKVSGREAIAKENPIVKANKLDRI